MKSIGIASFRQFPVYDYISVLSKYIGLRHGIYTYSLRKADISRVDIINLR